MRDRGRIAICRECDTLATLMVGNDEYMTRARTAAALAFLLIGTLACSPASHAAQPNVPTAWLPTSPPTETPIPTATATPSDTPAPTLTATIAPTLTDTPVSAAAPAASPGSAPVPYVNMMDISQYFSPSGRPVQSWNGIPIMPEATDGQAFQSGAVYSFKATATIADASSFYQDKLRPLGYRLYVGPASGAAGSGSGTIHSDFLGYSRGPHLLLIYIASYDIDAGHVFVVLSTQ